MIQGINSQTPALQDAVRRPAAASASPPNAFAALFHAQAETAPASASAAEPQAAATETAVAAETAVPAALPEQPAGVPVSYGPAAIENHMNQWWMGLMQHINANRTAVYNQAMTDWKANAARHRELGLQELPQPQAPQLEAVEAKPAGWWFEIHS